MKITIDVPEKEFGVDIADHFQNFFKRISVEIKKRLLFNDTLLCGNYELEISEMFLESFKNATLNPQPKTEHWIERELVGDIIKGDRKILMCSNCKLGVANGILGFANYCPNCGARMSEVEE